MFQWRSSQKENLRSRTRRAESSRHSLQSRGVPLPEGARGHPGRPKEEEVETAEGQRRVGRQTGSRTLSQTFSAGSFFDNGS